MIAYPDILNEWEKWRPCDLPLDECRWTLGGLDSSTDIWFSDDVGLIRQWRNSNTWNCFCFSVKNKWIQFETFLRNQMKCFNLVPSRLVLTPPQKTERLSLPHWLAPTCGHCSVSNNGRTGWNVEQTHTFGRLVIINEPLNLQKKQKGILVPLEKWKKDGILRVVWGVVLVIRNTFDAR